MILQVMQQRVFKASWLAAQPGSLAVSPENAVAVATAEASLVVDRLVGNDLFHFIRSLAALDADVLHHCSRSSLCQQTCVCTQFNHDTRTTGAF